LSKSETVKIKYLPGAVPLSKLDKGDWIDLRSYENVELKAGDSALISLGVAMELPDGYEAWIVPRSSLFKKFGVIQTNGIGIIDASYRGDGDIWRMPVVAQRDTVIPEDARICQFRIVKSQPKLSFMTVDSLNNENRGGFGSSGVE
jgi:dUTP pyrophosphatase